MGAETKPFRPSGGPDFAVPPGETLQEMLDQAGLSQADLAERTGRPKKTVNEIIQGKAAITPETALQLEKVLGLEAGYWLALEQTYRAALARQAERAALEQEVSWLREIPLNEMIKQTWVPKLSNKVDQLEAVLRYFGVASPKAWRQVWTGIQESIAYRKSTKFDTDFAAVATWLRRGELLAADVRTRPYNPTTFREALAKTRQLTTAWPFVEQLQALCADAGVVVQFVPEIKGLHVSGATRWLAPDRALIQLTLRGRWQDIVWFSFFHEAAHILLHGKRTVFVEPKDRKTQPAEQDELEADRFATDMLIPPEEYRRFVQQGRFTRLAVAGFAKEIGISPAIVVGRLQHDHLIGWNDPLTKMKDRYEWAEQ
jgi:HTH-type transcriptional regulator/antitoxin HigA